MLFLELFAVVLAVYLLLSGLPGPAGVAFACAALALWWDGQEPPAADDHDEYGNPLGARHGRYAAVRVPASRGRRARR